MAIGPLGAVLCVVVAQAPDAKPAVDLARLLEEFGDRAALARFPAPVFRAHAEPWRAGDATTGGEHVLFEAEGPGAITRIRASSPAGRLRVRCDGAEHAVLDVDMAALFRGEAGVPAPFASATAGGGNALVPIPFARRVVVTAVDGGAGTGVVEWRRYADDVVVSTPAPGEIAGHAKSLARAAATWAASARDAGELAYTYHLSRSAPEGELLAVVPSAPSGSRAITELRFRVDPRQLGDALRSCVLRMSFDGEAAVEAPLGLFFGTSGSTACTSVTTSGEMTARFVMPYRSSFELAIDNTGDRDLHVAGAVRTTPWTWDERSMHFRATWFSSGRFAPEATTSTRITGRGAYLGARLRVANTELSPWDAGTSLLADGTRAASRANARDVYGLTDCAGDASLGRSTATPWQGFVSGSGPRCFGEFELYRLRVLDAVPFERELVELREYVSSDGSSAQRAGCVYYYARPGATHDSPKMPARVDDAWPRLSFHRAWDAVEAEDARVADSAPDVRLERLPRSGANPLSGGQELRVIGRRAGDHVELEIPCDPGRRAISVLAARGSDLGRVRLSVDGRVAVEAHDAHAPEPPAEAWIRDVRGEPVESIDLGTHDVAATFRLRIEFLDDAPRARFALDAVVVR